MPTKKAATAATPDAPPDDDTLAAMAKAIAHPVRIAILRLLDHRETCMTGDVVAELPLAQSTVSEHLRILREAGLIHTTKQGVEHRNAVREADINARFPGLLKSILKHADE